MAAWVPFSLAAWLTIGSSSALATVVATTLLISLAHQPLTLGLIYGDPAQFAVAKKIFTFGPFVFVAAIIFGNWLSLALVGVVAGLWNAEHTLMQRYGLVRIYGRKAGEGQRSDEKPLLFSWLLFALAFAGEELPEKAVIHVAPAVVADGAADRVRHRGEIFDQILGAFAGEFRRAFERLVDVGHVRLVMLVVVNLHRLRVDVRFERSGGIRKGWKFVGHSGVDDGKQMPP